MTENQIENELKYYSFHENKKEKESKNKILNDVMSQNQMNFRGKEMGSPFKQALIDVKCRKELIFLFVCPLK